MDGPDGDRLRAPVCRSFGDAGAVSRRVGPRTTRWRGVGRPSGPGSQHRGRLPGGRPQAGEIGHGRRQRELGFGLEASAIARLAQAQLHQTGPSVFGHLPQGPVGRERRAGLKGPGILQQVLLGMQADAAPAPGFGLHTLRSQATAVTERTLKHKGLPWDPLPVPFTVTPLAVEAGRDFSRRTGAAADLQVDVEVLLGEI